MGCRFGQPFLLYNEETMYFVGINIGIDKTTVSRLPGYNGEQVSQIILDPHLGRESIDTAICKSKNDVEWSLVYNKVFRSDDIRSDFKGPISRLGPIEREAMMAFARLIFQTILTHDTDLEYNPESDEKNFVLGIACTVEWVRENPNAQQEYLDFFRNECGVPVDFCMNEKDAIYYSRCERFNEDDSVFVIDIGTSLIDFSTYVKSRCVSQCCWGTNLGTHMIQDALMPHIYGFDKNRENVARLKQFKANNGFIDNVEAAISLFVRSAIEEFYTENRDSFRLGIEYQELTARWTGYPWDICIAYDVSKDEFNRIIANYMQRIHETLQNARIKLNTNGITPKRILLSGGAIGMPFIQEYAEQIFGVKVDIDPQAEFSIANGIALYMYHDSMFLDKFLAELKLGLIGITVLNIDYQKIDMAIGHALRKSLPYDIDSSSIDSKRNLNISSHLFFSNKDANSILEERIMKYAIKVFREHMYFDVKY